MLHRICYILLNFHKYQIRHFVLLSSYHFISHEINTTIRKASCHIFIHDDIDTIIFHDQIIVIYNISNS